MTIGRGGIEVDEHMRAADGVWAIGDVTGIAMFTHVGKYHARIAAADMAGVTSVAELARLAERNQTLALDAQSGASAAG